MQNSFNGKRLDPTDKFLRHTFYPNVGSSSKNLGRAPFRKMPEVRLVWKSLEKALKTRFLSKFCRGSLARVWVGYFEFCGGLNPPAPRPPTPMHISIGIIGLLTNSFLIFLILKFRPGKKPHDWLILHLSFIDTCISISNSSKVISNGVGPQQIVAYLIPMWVYRFFSILFRDVDITGTLPHSPSVQPVFELVQ